MSADNRDSNNNNKNNDIRSALAIAAIVDYYYYSISGIFTSISFLPYLNDNDKKEKAILFWNMTILQKHL